MGDVPGELHTIIMEQKDREILRGWLRNVAKSESVEEFEVTIGIPIEDKSQGE